MGFGNDQKRKDSQQRRIEELASQFRKAKDDATKCRAEVDNILRAASADRAAARKELEDKFGIIQKLESENNRLRRVNENLKLDQDDKSRSSVGHNKQLQQCQSYLHTIAGDENGNFSDDLRQFARNQLHRIGPEGDLSSSASVVSDHFDEAGSNQSPLTLFGQDNTCPLLTQADFSTATSIGNYNDVELSPHSLGPLPSDFSNLSHLSDDIDLSSLMPQFDQFESNLASFDGYDWSSSNNHYHEPSIDARPQAGGNPSMAAQPTNRSSAPTHVAPLSAAASAQSQQMQRTMSVPANTQTSPQVPSPERTSSLTNTIPRNNMQFGHTLALRPKRPLPSEHPVPERSQTSSAKGSAPLGPGHLSRNHSSNAMHPPSFQADPNLPSDLSSDASTIRINGGASIQAPPKEISAECSDSDGGSSNSEHSFDDSQLRHPKRRASGTKPAPVNEHRGYSPPKRNSVHSATRIPPTVRTQRSSTGGSSGAHQAFSETRALPLRTAASSVCSSEASDLFSPMSRTSTQTSIQSVRSNEPDPKTLPDHKRRGVGRKDTKAPQDRPSSQREEGALEIAIRESYARFGLNAQQLKFCYEPQPLIPNAINLNTNWKQRSKLNESVVDKLTRLAEEITCFIPDTGGAKADKKESDLIRSLCHFKHQHVQCGSLKQVVRTLRSQRDVTRDELNLLDFEIYSTLIVMKRESEIEFEETIKGFSDYQGDLLGMYYSLHMFLSRLNSVWDGLHLLVLVYLLRAGAGRLLKFLVATTRPAAIELLLQRFEGRDMISKARGKMTQLVSLAGPTCTDRLPKLTPLKMLQDRVTGVTEPASVASALGYGDDYQNDVRLDSIRPAYPPANEHPDLQESSENVPKGHGSNTWRPREGGMEENSRLAKRRQFGGSIDSGRMRPLRSVQEVTKDGADGVEEQAMPDQPPTTSPIDLMADLSCGNTGWLSASRGEQTGNTLRQHDMFSSIDGTMQNQTDPRALFFDDDFDFMQSDFDPHNDIMTSYDLTTTNDFNDFNSWDDSFAPNPMDAFQNGTVDPRSLGID